MCFPPPFHSPTGGDLVRGSRNDHGRGADGAQTSPSGRALSRSAQSWTSHRGPLTDLASTRFAESCLWPQRDITSITDQVSNPRRSKARFACSSGGYHLPSDANHQPLSPDITLMNRQVSDGQRFEHATRLALLNLDPSSAASVQYLSHLNT